MIGIILIRVTEETSGRPMEASRLKEIDDSAVVMMGKKSLEMEDLVQDLVISKKGK